MRALVTGGAGFIGSTLVDRLMAEGHTVDVVDDLSAGSLSNLAEARAAAGHQLTFHRFDVRSDAVVGLVERRRPEVVFHLAAASPASYAADPVAAAEVDVLGSLRVLEAARLAGVRKVVFASDGPAVYGDVAPADLPAKESLPPRPRSEVGVAKMAVGGYLHAYRERWSLEYSALLLADVYGPRQAPDAGLVAPMVHALLAGGIAQVEGDGQQTRDFVYVDDVVDALARAATRGSGLAINIGTGVETSARDLYALVAAASAGSPAKPRRVPAAAGAGRPRRLALDAGRAAIHLGWSHWTSLAEGVATTVEWYRGQAG